MTAAKFGVIAALLFCTSAVHSQKVVEQLIKKTEKYNPLFGSQSTELEIMFIMSYDLPAKDSLFNVLFQVNRNQVRAQGSAVATGVVGNSFAGVSSRSTYYSIERSEGNLLLDYKSFDTLVNYFNDLELYSKNNHGRNRIITYSLENLKLSMEMIYRGGDNPDIAFERLYYLSIDGVTFKLSKKQLIDLNKNVIKEIKMAWDSWLETRSLPAIEY